MLKSPADTSFPLAAQKPYSATHHGHTRTDPYNWLRDQGYPNVENEEILSYLKAENFYFDTVMKPYETLKENLFREIKGRIKEDEQGVPWQDGLYDYRWAYKKGAQYRTWYYRPRSADPFTNDGWQLLFDEVQEAEGHEFFKLGVLAVSPNGKYLAFSVDTNGSERFTVFIRDLQTGELMPGSIEETSGEVVWNNKSTALATVKVSKEWRPYKVIRKRLKGSSEQLLFEEKDTSFFVHIHATTSHKYMIIRSADHVTAESHIIPLERLRDMPVCLFKRKTGHDYYVDHGGGNIYIRSNKDQKNFCIYWVMEEEPNSPWRMLLEGSDTRYIHGMQAFASFVVLEDRIDGQDQISILKGKKCAQIKMPEDVFEVGIGHNAEADQPFVRLVYSSLITPPTVFDYMLETEELVVRKEQEIPSGYDKDNYRSERLMIEARDGARIPVSIVYHKEWQKDKGNPLHLYGYGAYGLGMSPSFSAARLSLLDRGFAYAIAHIRGGDEMGYGWYEAGKLKKRTNTFNDFVDCARALTRKGYTEKGGITISGGSAGGELMGAVLNQAPDLFAGAVLHVPFVDVLNTMLDDSLPLTPIEWPEWGNPLKSRNDYETILAYCPYSNIEAKDYPPMMVTGGLNDPRVTYWEPAKWTAKLRATKTDDNLLLMKINMGAGHGGKSGRFERFYEIAEEYCFLLMCFGRTEK
ncbi:S9 family peptidase [Kordiimonas pumila]|uniref:S9 family peptidase n=1 Tax=Kordiimonas pumila TaxID=2161677 RepID=A0ABV7D0B0_9PROT|nr:S9 family peptidase [Kordiimonas pumila]